jgi:aminoglycoside phosphotransferase family enzyme/predicted kinase
VGEDDPAAVEYAVEMRRVEEGRSLAALANAETLDEGHAVAVAELLARFHREAHEAAPERTGVEAMATPIAENVDELADVSADLLDPRALDAARELTHRFIAARRAQLESRGRNGLVRDCHGDLRAEHVIVPPEGEVYVYDCVEFNPALREIDVGADLAFLVMDLARLGAEGAAATMVTRYREAGGDPGDDALLAFYAGYRAWVRAKVACLRVAELAPGDAERDAQRDRAVELLRLGRRFAWRARCPVAIVICGVAGSGKTTLARELAELGGLVHVSSDVTRKRLAGLSPTDRAAEEHYSPEFTLRTYAEMGAEARRVMDRGDGAIVDATFHRRDGRAAFLDALGEGSDEPIVFVECRAPREVLVDRVRSRQGEGKSTSDADVAIVERQLAALEPLDEIPGARRVVLDADAAVGELAVRVETLVDERIWRGDGP